MNRFHSNLHLVLLAFLGSGALSSCATYSLPTVRLESPEATGRVHQAKLEPIALISGTDLVSPPLWSEADPEEGTVSEPYAQGTLKPAIGGVFSVDEKLDLGLRISPQTPPLIRAKYQLSGRPEAQAEKGNVSVSAALAIGFLAGQMEGEATSFFMGDFALPVGYRLNAHHLFFLSPFVTIGSATGLTQSAGSATTSTPAPATSSARVSASATQYGAGLGYQFDLKYLDLRTEFAYTLGSVGSTQISGLNFGALAAFEL